MDILKIHISSWINFMGYNKLDVNQIRFHSYWILSPLYCAIPITWFSYFIIDINNHFVFFKWLFKRRWKEMRSTKPLHLSKTFWQNNYQLKKLNQPASFWCMNFDINYFTKKKENRPQFLMCNTNWWRRNFN